MKTLFILGACMILLAAASAFGQSEGRYTKPEDLAKLLKDKTEPFMLVDVRTPEEYASGHIPGAVNVPVDRIGKKPPTDDKKALIIVYCRSGNRSGVAKRTLDSFGYSRVEDFGGVGRYKGALVTGDKP